MAIRRSLEKVIPLRCEMAWSSSFQGIGSFNMTTAIVGTLFWMRAFRVINFTRLKKRPAEIRQALSAFIYKKLFFLLLKIKNR
jgi:hypothetical protein